MIEAASKAIVDIDVIISGRIEPTKENRAQSPISVDTAVAETANKYNAIIPFDAEW